MGAVNPDRADVMLVDAAATADHRQQPAGFGILLPSDAQAKPDAALRHAVAEPRLLSPRVRAGWVIVAARVATLPLFAAIVTRPAEARAGIEDVFGRRKPRAIKPRQRGGDRLGRALGEQRARQCQIVLGRLLREQ